MSDKGLGWCGSGNHGADHPGGVNNASQQEGRFSKLWSGQAPAVCPHQGNEVHYLDQVHIEGKVNGRKWSDNDRQKSVENEYNE